MARKSKKLIWIEKLQTVSECPQDIFEFLTPSDELLVKIEQSENGDLFATEELVHSLFEILIAENVKCSSFKYFANFGLNLGSVEVCDMFMSYIISQDDGIEKIQKIGDIVSEKAPNLLEKYETCKAIIDANSADEKTACNLIQYENNKFIRDEIKIYVFSRALLLGCKTAEILKEICVRNNLEPILALPSVSAGAFEKADNKFDCTNYLKKYLYENNNSHWQDFFTRCLYEYCEMYKNSDFSAVAEDFIKISYSRKYCSKHILHALLWIKYLKDNSQSKDEERLQVLDKSIEDLEKECSFAGISVAWDDEIGVEKLRREAIYTFTEKERKKTEEISSLGDIIVHGRNRYSLECTLKNHAKRGKKHFWETTVAFPLEDNNAMPIFYPIKIGTVNNNITRGGTNLTYSRTNSQILGIGEIEVNEVKHPLSIDFILDIAYISSVKCETVEFKIKSSEKVGNYIKMVVQIFLY